MRIDQAIQLCILQELEQLISTEMEFEGKDIFQQLYQHTYDKANHNISWLETMQIVELLCYQNDFVQFLVYQLTEQLQQFSEIQMNSSDFCKPLLPSFSQLETMLFVSVLNTISSVFTINT